MRKIQSTIDSITLHRPWLRHINGDLFDISNRIRKIDDGYFIVFNRVSGYYEVHNVDTRRENTYEFTVPFDALDCRTLDFCEKTMMKNKEKLIAEMEKNIANEEKAKFNKMHNENESRAIELANDLRRAI